MPYAQILPVLKRQFAKGDRDHNQTFHTMKEMANHCVTKDEHTKINSPGDFQLELIKKFYARFKKTEL